MKFLVGAFTHSGKVYLTMPLAAFSAKYGNPTAETRVWQNGRGARFDNATFIWKFRCGNLELESLGWDLNTSSFQLTCPANQPPLPPPVVDF